jgi:hypothetical protein
MSGTRGYAFFLDSELLLGTVMIVSAGNASFFEKYVGFLVFAATAEPSGSGLFTHLSLVRFD